jgi:hypothetical protein
MWLLCRGGDLAKADLAEPALAETDPDEVDLAVLILAIPPLANRPSPLGAVRKGGGCPCRNCPLHVRPRSHSLQAPLFPISLTLGENYSGLPTSKDRTFWGLWDRLGAFYATLRELFEPDPHLSLCG